MALSGWFHVSLAAKCRLLFGLAVALIIAAALFVPWYAMGTMVHTLNVQRARHLAVLAHARIDSGSSDWQHQQLLLDLWWKKNAGLLDLPEEKPRLILLSPPKATLNFDQRVLERVQGPIRTVRRSMRLITRYVPLPLELQLPGLLWEVLPETVQDRAVFRGQVLIGRLYRSAEPVPPQLDRFQRASINKMRGDEEPNETWETAHEPGQPTIYRYILAVRGEERASARRPLIGIIEMKLPLGSTDTLLVVRVVIVLAGLLAGFLAILVFYLITQKLILAPVRELRRLAERVTGGDLTARSTIDTADEFEELSDAFNDMLSRLERSRLELEMINRSLDTRLGELAETNVSLFESNRIKSEFLANVSHELRTPLTSIIGFADLLRDSLQGNGTIDSARSARYADNILSSGRMLLDIINDLLDLAKIEAGKIELHRATFAAADVCEALADFMRPLVDKKGLTLIQTMDESLPMMNSDAGKLRQVLYNLLSNAIKYTPEGGTIRFDAQAIDGGRRLRLTVADTGPGIAPEDQDTIFEKFRQLDASVTREHSGTGLGLPISRELCTMLGGTLRVESRLGQGAIFIVELPIECPETVQRPLPSLT